MSTVTKPKPISISAEQRQLEERLDEAEIKAFLAQYTPAHQAIRDLKEELLHHLHKLLSNYKSEAREQILMTLGVIYKLNS